MNADSFADTFELDRDDFQNWLSNKPSASVVGYTCDADDCPLSRYIRETKTLPSDCIIEVHDQWVVLAPTDISVSPVTRIQLEPWAISFVRLIDHYHGCGNIGWSVTAEDAAEILRQRVG